ncbi:MAG: hypothetical protein NC924_09665 [Candidatus Omnitrophica bacterium]|nr:hypothetical protein [Candidatus Omnitrophota bacterium]
MSMVQQEIVRAAAVAGAYVAVLALGEGVRRVLPAFPEISRKTVHLLSGLIAVFFPWIFHSPWTVLALSLGFCLLVEVSRRCGFLLSVHGVPRVSRGGQYFPLAVYILFLVGRDQPVFYGIAILVMAVSDTLAALVGGKYGAIKFDVEGNLKSLEGSTAFFFVTFLCIHVPLLLLTDIGRAESVLISGIIALLVTGFEAIALSGSDNIFVPLGTFFMLAKFTTKSLQVVAWQGTILIMLIAAGVLMYTRPRIFKASGLIAIILLNYAALSLCNYFWFLPLFLAQILYYICILAFVRAEGAANVSGFQVKVLLYSGGLPAALLFAANALPDYMSVYLPYVTAMSAQLAIIGIYFLPFLLRLVHNAPERRALQGSAGLFWPLLTVFFIAGVPLFLYMPGRFQPAMLLVAGGTLSAYVLDSVWRRHRHSQAGNAEHRRRFFCAAAGAAAVYALQRWCGI